MVFTKRYLYSGTEGDCVLECDVNVSNEMVSENALITFAPATATEDSRPGVVKLPKKFLEQLITIPVECYGIPIQVLIKIANQLNADKGKSLILETRQQTLS